MKVGQFELTILDVHGRTRRETAEGYVPLRHGEPYQIGLRNTGAGRCNLKVAIDGTPVGDFQIGPYGYGVLERPADGDGRFTFFAAGTAEGQAAGAGSVAAADRGLVQVTFSPEAIKPRQYPNSLRLMEAGHFRWGDMPNYAPCFGATGALSAAPVEMCSSKGIGPQSAGFGAGVTGQTGHSDQRFGVAPPIAEDAARRTVITLRLVLDRSAAGPRPLPGRLGNVVPPPVG